MQPFKLARLVEERLPGEPVSLLRSIGEATTRRGQRAYIVGGVVRDLLLKLPTKDIDVVVDGDVIPLAEEILGAFGGKIVVHRRFGTAKYKSDGTSFDLATARSESYPRPGALPVVIPDSMESDLARRDFSINAMAICINPVHFGELLDPHGGFEDLKAGLVRVLHDGSFVDDATRIFRAIRYEQRLGFRLESHTEELLRGDKGYLNTISGDRLRRELELVLREERPELALSRAHALSVLGGISPSLKGDDWLRERFQYARSSYAAAGLDMVYLCLLTFRASPGEIGAIIRRLNFPRRASQALMDTIALKGRLQYIAAASCPSTVYEALKGYSLPAIRACEAAVDSPEAKEKLGLYLSELRYVKSSLDGEDLKGMGISQGPELGQILQALLEARLDGLVRTRRDEESFVRKWLARRKKPRR